MCRGTGLDSLLKEETELKCDKTDTTVDHSDVQNQDQKNITEIM